MRYLQQRLRARSIDGVHLDKESEGSGFASLVEEEKQTWAERFEKREEERNRVLTEINGDTNKVLDVFLEAGRKLYEEVYAPLSNKEITALIAGFRQEILDYEKAICAVFKATYPFPTCFCFKLCNRRPQSRNNSDTFFKDLGNKNVSPKYE